MLWYQLFLRSSGRGAYSRWSTAHKIPHEWGGNGKPWMRPSRKHTQLREMRIDQLAMRLRYLTHVELPFVEPAPNSTAPPLGSGTPNPNRVAVRPTPCTAQLGTAGPWHERLPHFRYDETPSVGDELQSEFFVDFANGAAAMRAVAALSATLDPVLAVSELRCVAADSQWLSPARGRDSLALHFTWRGGRFDAVWHACALVEQALAPLDYRPHLGKVFTRLPHLDANAKRRFEALQRRMGGDVFRNDFCDAYLFGGSGARSVRSRRALHGAPKL
jgi:hypothetical protein